ncbi:MAG: DUF7668 domain-containing protein [Gaiellaceae bacterium]
MTKREGVPDLARPLIAALVRDLAAGEYDTLVRDGRAGRLTADELRQAVHDYPATLIPLPDAAFDIAGDAYLLVGSDPPQWAVDQDLWTREEGHSDLTLQVDVRFRRGAYRLEITGLHVL